MAWGLVVRAAPAQSGGPRPASPARQTAPHYVFAHYLVCHPTYGANLAGYEREIQEAQAAGIDGFALDEGAYDDPVWFYYNINTALIYRAAEELNTGFKLFFSVDFANTDSIVHMISTYAARTNTFRHDGKVVVSTYAQTGLNWLKSVFVPLKRKGISVFFIPYFLPNPVRELPSYQDGVNILNTYSNLLDGLFYWGAAGLPAQLSACNSNYNLAAHQAGKLFMASVAPHYWGCVQLANGRRYYEFHGGEGTISQWQSIIANQPDWVEINTWNDYYESTYISPVGNPGQYEPLANPVPSEPLGNPVRYCHSGFLALSQRYIAWYKTGRQPPLTNDELYYFYRTHSTKLVASDTHDTPATHFFGDVADVIYNTVFLTAPAQLEIYSGTNSFTNTLAAGLQQLRTPFSPGPQTFILRRNGMQLRWAQGPPVLSRIKYYDYFPASGLASQPAPNPPTDLRVLPVSNSK
jgi:glucan endo-1,3-alpha-glucosidase